MEFHSRKLLVLRGCTYFDFLKKKLTLFISLLLKIIRLLSAKNELF